MMATTHVLAGMALVGATAQLAPEFAPVALIAAAVGSAFPDLDLLGEHRRTLHFPVYYSIAALVAGVLAAVAVIAAPAATTTAVVVALAAFLAAAALHSVMDAFGGGLELKPWRGTSDRAVYSHYHGRWIRPRRWIRYDGAPEDVAFAVALAVPTLLLSSGWMRIAVGALLVLSVAYGLIRKPLVGVGEWLVDALPDRVVDRLPAGLVDDLT